MARSGISTASRISGEGDTQAREGTRTQSGIIGIEGGADAQGAGIDVDTVVDEVELTVEGEVFLSGQLQFHRQVVLGGDMREVLVPGQLADVDIGVQLTGLDQRGQHAFPACTVLPRVMRALDRRPSIGARMVA